MTWFERDPLEPLKLTRLIYIPDHQVLSVGEIKIALSISLRAAYRLMESGKIQSKRDGRRIAAFAKHVKEYALRSYSPPKIDQPGVSSNDNTQNNVD